MAGKTYVTKGYSTYTNIPSQGGGYDHEPKHLVNKYAVETKTNERVVRDFVGSPSKVELLREYVHSPSMVSPTYTPKNHYEDYESGPGRGYFSEESNRIGTSLGLGLGLAGSRGVKNGNSSVPNKSWQTVGPPATRHPVTTSTNNVSEAMGLLEDSVYYLPRADPRRRSVLDELYSTRAQPLEPQKRYARPAFVAKPNDPRHNLTSTRSAMDSREAMRRYRGSLVP